MGLTTRPSQILGVDGVFQQAQKNYNTAKVVNGGIDFGISTQINAPPTSSSPSAIAGSQDPGTQYTGNVNGQWVNVTAPATANTEFRIQHHLNRTPSWYIWNSDVACQLYQLPDTGTPWTQPVPTSPPPPPGSNSAPDSNLYIYLKCSVGGAKLRIFIS